MKPLPKITTDTLYWRQPRFKGSYELFDGDEVIGMLYWEGFLTQRITASIAGNNWTIEPGFQGTTVYDPRAGNIAIYQSTWGFWSWTGTLTLQDGTTYRQVGNLWRTRWRFDRVDGLTLIHFKKERSGMFKKGVRVEIAPEAHALLELPLLLVLGAFVAGDPTDSSG